MVVDTCLILSAGFGTRMGDITKVIPKPLLPVFNKTIIELQISYAITIGIKKIYINLHHHFTLIEKFLKDNDFKAEIILVHEEEILDIGGGIHNVALKENYKGNLLVISGDQFLFFDFNSVFKKMKKQLTSSPVSLIAIKVLAEKGYNALEVENELLKEVIQNKDLKSNDIYTYSGLSIINLEKISPVTGASKYFDSIANYKKENIAVCEVSSYDYIDFGTKERYFDSLEFILKERQSSFHEFFKKSKGIIFENQFNFKVNSTEITIDIQKRTITL